MMDLTRVTQNNLLDDKGSLWATAQQIDARQKFELSIRCVFSTINMHWNFDTQVWFVSEGLKSKYDPYYVAAYWRGLGDSVFFQGYRLVDCIARIHDDGLKIWNFNDPFKVSVSWYYWRPIRKRTSTFILQILSGEEFFKVMMELLEPLSEEVIRHHRWVALQTRINVTWWISW